MGGYLNNIIARSAGLAPVAKPRPLSMYEPVAAAVTPVAEWFAPGKSSGEDTALEACRVVDSFREVPAGRNGSSPAPSGQLRTGMGPEIPDSRGAGRTADQGIVSGSFLKAEGRNVEPATAGNPFDQHRPGPAQVSPVVAEKGADVSETVNTTRTPNHGRVTVELPETEEQELKTADIDNPIERNRTMVPDLKKQSGTLIRTDSMQTVLSGIAEKSPQETGVFGKRDEQAATPDADVNRVKKISLVQENLQISASPHPSTACTVAPLRKHAPPEVGKKGSHISANVMPTPAVPSVAESAPVAGHDPEKPRPDEDAAQSRPVFKPVIRHVAENGNIPHVPVRTDEHRPAGGWRREQFPVRGEKVVTGKPVLTPTINVTIGRIEVKATLSEQTEKRKTAPRSSSLDEYLGRRGKGGHR